MADRRTGIRQQLCRALFLWFVTAPVLTLTAAEPSAKYALLVGVSKYRHARMNSVTLKYPEADARALGELLRRGGYTVKLLLGKEATLEAVMTELKSVGEQGTQEGAVLVGLFGHGVQYGSDAYFGPYDTGIRPVTDATGQVVRNSDGRPKLEPDPESMLSMRAILDAFHRCGAGNRVLLADCCREDPAAARGRAFGSKLRVADLPTGTAALFACSVNERAFEHDDWQHGAFTRALLDECRGATRVRANVLSVAIYDRVLKMVHAKTNGRSRQRVNPIINGIVDLKLEVATIPSPQPSPVPTPTPPPRRPAPPQPMPTPRSSGQQEIASSIGLRLRRIPAGEFLMGSPSSEENHDIDEQQHRVRITRPFYIGIHEVTQGQWKAVMGTEPWQGKEYVKEGADYAACFISWEEAQEFCRKLGEKDGATYRLPTEAEWEYACRGGTSTMYSFGDDTTGLADHAWFEDNAWNGKQAYVHMVGQKKPNAWGLFDMHGNVWEWCSDWYAGNYYEQFKSDTAVDPQGPEQSRRRVYRGGSWFRAAKYARSAYRSYAPPDTRNDLLGFRVVRVAADR